jgi:hypothetical protein
MADNVLLNAGTGGETCATDDVAGVQYQRVKLTDGTADSTTDIRAGHGTAANAIRVELPTDGTGVIATVGAVTAITNALPAGTNAIGKLAANSGVDIGDVDVTTLPAVTIAAAQTLATVTTVGTVSSVTAIANALPAGNNNIGDVDIASIAAGDNNIGNVDIVTMPNVTLAAGTNTNEVVGDAAHDAAAAGNPVLVGAYASAAAPTDVSADADAVRLWALRSGALATQPTYGGVLAVAGNGAAGTGVQRVTLANDSTGVLATVSTVTTVTNITNQGQIADDAAFTPATTRVNMAGFFADESSTDSVDEGDGGAARMTLDRKQIVTPYVHAAAGGATPHQNLDVDETEDDIKTSPGKLFWVHVVNLSNAKRYIKFYNATAANTTVGSTTPVLTFPIPTMGDTNGAGFTINFGDVGVQFDTAICVAATTGFAVADTGAPGANEIILNCGYA